MLFLCDTAVQYAFEQCDTQPQYKVLIVASPPVFLALNNNIRHNHSYLRFNDSIQRISTTNSFNMRIEFSNESMILIVCADCMDRLIAMRVHLVIADRDLGDTYNLHQLETLSEVVRPPWYNRGRRAEITWGDIDDDIVKEVLRPINRDEDIPDISIEDFDKIIGI